ncbi:class D beta-lactamase [Dendronalium sp. ChiSLP03b]|uniref:class D beta-lactamase n=1 Tax=Dendronalium sp. ChiSLP03b TaxID=3075381 RepID=UPI002AD3C234|nr:class D beta-lactamase [Dendronalium sp. ChiSLP03b]MDZ8204838.1 class D beta-lactamase [Dendronalium sp. ChiSLP03b]
MAQIRRMPLVIAIAVSILVTLVTIFPGIPARSQAIQTPSVVSANPVTQGVDLERSFRELGIEGSILIYDQNNKKFYEHNAARNSQAFFPASTFKIFNSLVALETGVIPNEVAVLTWDGIQRQIPVWNQDTNIRQAFKNSTVWFYQVLARKIGRERMQKFINQVGYGNRQIGTPEQIDRFWLEGPLQITPKQQIEFLQRLYHKELPFSQRTFDLVQDIMVFERTPDYVLRGKTGWATSVTPNIGWFVGYLEQNNNVYFFATNIDMRDADDAATRIEITRRSLKALKLL